MSRGDVVVRIRQIAEDRAVAEVAMANHAAAAARNAADEARLRARTHPLAGSAQSLRGDDLHASLGMAAALRESVRIADQYIEAADSHLASVRQVADSARADRKAAERIAERRRAAWEAEVARRDQRALDEAGLATRYLR